MIVQLANTVPQAVKPAQIALLVHSMTKPMLRRSQTASHAQAASIVQLQAYQLPLVIAMRDTSAQRVLHLLDQAH